MKVKVFNIPHELKNYILKISFFESNSGLPDPNDMMLVAPSGLVRLVIPCNNNLSLRNDEWLQLAKEDKMMLIGIHDLPIVVDFEKGHPSALLQVEFSPLGAYRFFHLRQTEIKNRSFPVSDILDKSAPGIEERIVNTADIDVKIKLLTQFLLYYFEKSDNDLIFEHCVNRIINSHGNVSIEQLATETGYSGRWLNMKFKERLGLNPKSLCSILRFHLFYSAIMIQDEEILKSKAFFDFYYDQAHFIKDFKRFTGFTPGLFESTNNNFCRLFYMAQYTPEALKIRLL
ncbi:helix-turn-helix domain-containing protein [Arcticibacter tournemirensis]|uniref:AraC family transcriptional regulator n=1 Tax=Arcticibacter tournemirensis TaxID=699437 RepID=A0A4Q0MDW2_9SPHI|nr:AraC family transcriptional regulator [Arcticibacter tournemirensis]RXF71611.1 AraC family transcriptional regulator [Arcticibacter tournemirensis]